MAFGLPGCIDFPGASSTGANGINPEGDIVGSYYNGTSPGSDGFLLSKGALTTIDVPGAFTTVANGINSKGDIVGYYGVEYYGSTTGTHGFLLSQ
jgi:uncharacterized membrane protein